MDNKYKILEMHICSFECSNDKKYIKTDLNKYPKRLCILDKNNKIVIDVLTLHKYQYIRTINMKYCVDNYKREKIISGKRYACFENEISLSNFDSRTIKLCNKIMKLLDKGIIFKDGNEELTNDEYLKLIENNKLKKEKIYRKKK